MSEYKPLPTLVGALLLRAATQGSLVLVRALLSHPTCDLMARDEEGNTALHIAASSGHHDVVEELAGKYSEPTAGKNSKGHTPLHLSCSKGWTKCVNILANTFPGELQMKDNDGHLPADAAHLNKHDKIVTLLHYKGEALQPKANGLSCSMLSKNERTPEVSSGGSTTVSIVTSCLLRAAKQGSLVLVRALLSHPSCDLMARDEEGNTALHIAASSGHHDVVEELAGRYSEPTAGKNNQGHTPLHLACSKGWTKCVSILTAMFPGELQMKENDGNLPADLACLYRHGTIVALFEAFKLKETGLSYYTLNDNKQTQTPRLSGSAELNIVISCLFRAAKQGSLVLVRALLSHRSCDLMARDEEGNTALHIAASSGHHDVVEVLAGRYSTPTAGENNEGHTPLHLACSKGWTKCVSILTAMLPGELQMKDNDGNLPADLAHLYGHGTIMALLEAFKSKETGLSYYTLNDNEQTREPTLSSSTGLNIVTPCLLRAAKQGSLVLVKALLSHPSCDLMARDEEGNTALHIAASSGHQHVVEELAFRTQAIRIKPSCFESECSSMQKGSQPAPKHISPVECPNSAGNTPLMVASKKGKVCVVKILLSKCKANSLARNKHNNSCMHLAALHGHIPVIDLLVHEFGCSPHTKGYRRRTPLHYASGGGHVELVDKMISEYKCDKMARDIEGRTPLHMAALHGKKSVVKLLISKHKCPVECTDKKGNTALLCASSRGHASVVIMLHTEFGASVTIYKYEKHFPKMYGDVGMAVPKTTQTRYMDGSVQATQMTTQVTPSLHHFSFLSSTQSSFQYSDNKA